MEEEGLDQEECVIPEIAAHRQFQIGFKHLIHTFRWYIVAVFGTLLSVISLISNILIARVLLQRKHSNFFFLGLLAVSDVFLSFCYFPVVAIEVVRYTIGVSLTCLFYCYKLDSNLGLCAKF
jgi:hypothetical protein